MGKESTHVWRALIFRQPRTKYSSQFRQTRFQRTLLNYKLEKRSSLKQVIQVGPIPQRRLTTSRRATEERRDSVQCCTSCYFALVWELHWHTRPWRAPKVRACRETACAHRVEKQFLDFEGKRYGEKNTEIMRFLQEKISPAWSTKMCKLTGGPSQGIWKALYENWSWLLWTILCTTWTWSD